MDHPDPIERREESRGRIVSGNLFIALADLNPDQEGDLPLKKGDIIAIIETRYLHFISSLIFDLCL